MTSLQKFIAGALSTLLLTTAAVAQSNYPNQPIRFIVPWPPGGTTDALARLLAKNLFDELGQTVVVENIAGSGGNIGTQRFIQAKPDGYTLLMASSSTNAANPHLYKQLGFDPIKDFTPLALVAVVPSVMIVGADSRFKSVSDILNAARANPGTLFYASAGVGSSAHLAGEYLKNLAKINVTHTPYKGIGPAFIDIIAGRVDYSFDTGVSPTILGGKVRALAVAGPTRIPALPQIPTFAEYGVNGMHMNIWFGVAAPANMPAALANRLNGAINVALTKGELPQRLRALGSDAPVMNQDAFNKFWRSEVTRYAEIVKLSGAGALD